MAKPVQREHEVRRRREMSSHEGRFGGSGSHRCEVRACAHSLGASGMRRQPELKGHLRYRQPELPRAATQDRPENEGMKSSPSSLVHHRPAKLQPRSSQPPHPAASRACRPTHGGQHAIQAQDGHVCLKLNFKSVGRMQRRLTPRSRRGPTASQPARRAWWFILRPAGGSSCRRPRLTSNVRRRNRNQPRYPSSSSREAMGTMPAIALCQLLVAQHHRIGLQLCECYVLGHERIAPSEISRGLPCHLLQRAVSKKPNL